MARYARARSYGSRGRGYARRGYSAASRNYGSKVGLSLSPAFLAGAVIGFTDLDKNIPGQLVLGAATVPVKGLGMVKGMAQGVIFGNLIQQIKDNKGVSGTGYQNMVTL